MEEIRDTLDAIHEMEMESIQQEIRGEGGGRQGEAASKR
jgi:hypothetical protein